jgi:2-dehydropantoate 2-reductase
MLGQTRAARRQTMPDRPSFAVMGAGGVGGAFGLRLARAGYPVTFVARGAHLAAIREGGLRLEAPDGAVALEVAATDNPASIGPVDFVFFTVKLWSTEEAAAQCRPLLGPETAVVSFQNGIDALDILAGILGERHVMGGVAEISATIRAPGVIAQTSPFFRLRFGELDGAASPRTRALAAALAAAGIEHEASADIRLALWQKFVFLTGLSALTALTRHPIGPVRRDPDTRALLEAVVAEAAAVGRAEGIALPKDVVAGRMAALDGLPEGMRASMAIDLAEGRPLELPWLSGAVVRLGRAHGLATPANAFVTQALKLDAAGRGAA